MKVRIIAMIATVGVLLAVSVFTAQDYAPATPFGLIMGMRENNLVVKKTLATNKFEIVAPKPHPDFSIYVVEAGPKTGVCYVRAATDDMVSSPDGAALKRKFDSIRDQLNATYGTSEFTDHLMTGSIWHETQDWMMSILKDERFYAARWVGSNQKPLRPNLESVYLSVGATRQDRGWLSVEYIFVNRSGCDQEKKEAERSVF